MSKRLSRAACAFGAVGLALWFVAWAGLPAEDAPPVAFAFGPPGFVAASPGDLSTGVTPGTALTWNFTSASSYDLYYGTTNPPPLLTAGLTTTTATPTELGNTTYYWQVAATGGGGTSTSAVFTFTTGAAVATSSKKKSGPCQIAAADHIDLLASLLAAAGLVLMLRCAPRASTGPGAAL